MTKEEFFNGLNALSQEFQKYSEQMGNDYPQFYCSIIPTERTFYFSAIITKDWRALSYKSKKAAGELSDKLDRIIFHQGKINELQDLLSGLKADFNKYYVPMKNLANWNEIKTKFEEEFKNKEISSADTDAFIKKLGENSAAKLSKQLQENIERLVEILDYIFCRNLALYMYNYSANSISDFNALYEEQQQNPADILQKALSIKKTIDAGRKEIFKLLKSGNENVLKEHINSFQTYLQSTLGNEILQLLVYSLKKRNSTGASFSKEGKFGLKVAKLFQDSLLLLAEVKWIGWRARWHKDISLRKELSKKISSLKNVDIKINGKAVPVKLVAKSPSKYHKKKIIVEGVVSNLNIRHVYKKAISQAEVQDAKGNKILIVLPYIKLDSCGIVNGSYLKVAGIFDKKNKEAKNLPALQVDRLNLSDLSSTNWNAWVQHELVNIFEPVSHNLETSFTLEAGNDGAINPVKYGTSFTQPKRLIINKPI